MVHVQFPTSSKAARALASLNTEDIPEAECRASRVASKHWASPGGRRLQMATAGEQHEWCRRFNCGQLAPVPEDEMGDRYSSGHIEIPYPEQAGSPDVPIGALDLGAFLPVAGGMMKKAKRRGPGKALSASWTWTKKAPGPPGGDKEKEAAAEQEEAQPEWPALRPTGRSEGSEANWEVCSTVSSLASSWALLEEEQDLGLLAEEFSKHENGAPAPAAPSATPGKKDTREEASAAPALSFADALRQNKAQQAAAEGAAVAEVTAPGRDDTRVPAKGPPRCACALEQEGVSAAQQHFEHEDDDEAASDDGLPRAAIFGKDGRGGRWMKGSKASHSTAARKRAARAVERRDAQRAAAQVRGG